MKTITDKQRNALEKFRVVRDMQVRNCAAVAAEMGCVPSRWVFVTVLTSTHKIPLSIINALVKKGFLKQRPTDGWGPEVSE